jgi:hypothetical protein
VFNGRVPYAHSFAQIHDGIIEGSAAVVHVSCQRTDARAVLPDRIP